MHTAIAVALGVAVLGCATERQGDGTGQDSLPKRGPTEMDPTILSTTSRCIAGLGTYRAVELTITASDLRGKTNLGTCEATLGGITDQSEFGENATCSLEVELPGTQCVEGTDYVIDLVVANETGGFTTASLRVRPQG